MVAQMTPRSILIYGPPGSGKSTVGRLLASSLELPFFDLDKEIEVHSNKTIPGIFESEGETGFRARETTELHRCLSGDDGVVALGGGTLLDSSNRSLVESRGTIILLTAPPEILASRLSMDENRRPLLAGDEKKHLFALMSTRAGHYSSFPDQLDTSPYTTEQVVMEAQIRLGMFRVKGMGRAGNASSDAYDVRVNPGGLIDTGRMLLERGIKAPVMIVSDENVGPLYSPRITESLRKAGFPTGTTLISPGEIQKNMRTVHHLWDSFVHTGLERGSTVLALGGGVINDLAGFAAATFLRGIRWVSVPTSLLAMVDASLGGKTGVDLPQGKNLIGAFHSPALVLADTLALASLPVVEMRCGLAEVVKQGIIGDPALYDCCASITSLHYTQESANLWNELVQRAMAVKIKVIEADPYEQGWRAVLNLGHTIGHAVELASGYQLRHGEAVAIGLVAEARLSEQIGLAETGLAENIARTLANLGLPTEIPSGLDTEMMIQAIGLDKKHAGGKVRFALPVKVGEVKTGVEIDDLRRYHGLGSGSSRT